MNVSMYLCQQIKSLYKNAGRLNLYLSLCNGKDTIDIERLRFEIRTIKSIVSSIEDEIQ